MNLLDRFAASLSPTDAPMQADVRDYVEWQAGRRAAEFAPDASDDVEVRTYLLHLRLAGVERAALNAKAASLKRFYEWAKTEGLIESDPFSDFNFERPFLSRDQIRRRQDTLSADPREREIARLRAINRLAEELNRSADLQTALDVALATVVEVMGLKTAWAFLHTDSGLDGRPGGLPLRAGTPPHDFALAAACGLPPGLEQDERRFLCQPPDCHCQFLLHGGRLTRAVNVVECTRLQNSAEAAGDNRGLLFHASVPLISQGRSLGILNFATDEWQFLTAADLQLLSAVGAHVSTALERARLYDLAQAQRARLERELEMARAVQASLLPERLPEVPGFSLAADWRAAREVAGDFYDIFPLPGGRWAFVIADVSDKGAPAALYMAMTSSLIRSQAGRTPEPAALLTGVNGALCAQSSSNMFVTVICAVLDPATRMLTYANAGHNLPLLRRASGQVESQPRGGSALGVFDDLSLPAAALALTPGDALVAYTDGVTDALNPQGEEYGLARLTAALAVPTPGSSPGTGEESAPALLAHVLADLAAFTQDAPQADDITLFVVACGRAGRWRDDWPSGGMGAASAIVS